MFRRALFFSALILSLAGIANAQSPFACNGTAVNTLVRSEGLAERLGDINLSCTGGAPGSTVTFNLAVFLNVGFTNHVTSTGVTDVSLVVDNATGAVVPPAILQASNGISFNGVTFTIPASGPVNLRISNLRGNVSQLGTGSQRPVEAVVSITGTPLVANSFRLSVGVLAPGLLASFATTGIRCVGSPLPSNINFANLLLGGTAFVSTRVTEGFASAFEKKGPGDDNGTRIVARFTGLPAGARLFVPNVVAGSDAVQPTIAGDLGGTPSGGAYAPTVAGSLLLVRVNGTDANGAGGTLAYTTGPIGSGTVAFNSVGEVGLSGGAGIAVFEVVDSNPSVHESAQFPTFLGLPTVDNDSVAIASERVSFGPNSTVFTASATDPVPRFTALNPQPDCASIGDCGVNFPVLSLRSSRPLEFTATSGSVLQTIAAQINNRGGGIMRWSASVTTTTGSKWLSVYPATGVGNGSVFVNVLPLGLSPGVYTGSLIVDVPPPGVRQTLPVRLTIIAPPAAPVVTPPVPAITKVGLLSLTNAARPDLTTVSPGSLAIVNGSNLKGKDVAVTFDGIAAPMLSGDDRSINIQVPGSLRSPGTSQLQVTVDGEKSIALPVSVSELAPAIFAEGVLNEDNSVNKESNGAATGSVLQIFSTGLLGSVPGPVLVHLHDLKLTPSYAGPAPSLAGVDQVNVVIPDYLPAMTTEIRVCGFAASNPDRQVCSEPAKLTIK